MYPVSLDYQEKIKENNRLLEATIQIQHSKGVLNLSDKDLVAGTLIHTESSQAGEEFTIGSTVASDISLTILNKPEYEDINFMGATITCNIGLLVEAGADAHFLQPSQPSKMLGFEEKWEYVPLGRFNIDDAPRQRNTIELKAIDNMIKFDLPYSLSKLSYPATLYQIYINACNVCDVLPGTTSFPNMHHVVKERPQDDLTFRDIIGYVAELSGTFAKCNRNGASELSWYKSTGLILDPSNRFDFKPSDDSVQIKGIMATVEDTTYLTGTDDYAIDLTDNPLLQGDYETVLPNIFDNVKDTVFTPYTSNWQGNMAIQTGDIITQIDRDGKTYNTLITKSVYKYRGRSILEAKGLPEISKGYKGSTNRKIAQIRRVIEKEVGDKLTSLEQAQLNSTELLANMLGGYIIEDKPNGIFYIADNPNIDLAMKVWKYGINGFGYSSTGKNGPYTTAVTADGSIVAMLVSANIITANMINAGLLQSTNGKSWFNLDNGVLHIGHGGVNNQYSEMNADGFVRKWEYGVSHYLSDIHVVPNLSSDNDYDNPISVVVTLPERFKGRGATTQVMLAFRGTRMNVGGIITDNSGKVINLASYHNIVLKVTGSNFNLINPEIYIDSYAQIHMVYTDGERRTYYRNLDFDVIIISN